jgi:hypothetical protein
MTSQLVPVLTKFMTSPLPSESLKLPEDYSMTPSEAPEVSLSPKSLPQPRKGWWSRLVVRFWEFG